MKLIKISLSIAAALVAAASLGLWLLVQPPPCVQRTLDSQWNAVVSSGGCMMGYEDWMPSVGAGPWEGWSVDSCWTHITTGGPDKVIPFLITKLNSRRITGVHVDPFEAAIEGELAVYTLQHATHKNWYEYQGENSTLNAALKARRTREQQPSERYLDYPNDQQLLQKILNNQQAREVIKQYFSGERYTAQQGAPFDAYSATLHSHN